MPEEKQKQPEKQKPPAENPKPEDLQLLEEQRRQRFLEFVTSEGKAPKPDVKEPDRKTKPARRGLSLGQKLLIGTGIGLAVASGAGVAHGDTIYLEHSRPWEPIRVIENIIITEETPEHVKFYIPGAEYRPLTFERKYIKEIERSQNIVKPSTREEAEKRYADAKSKYAAAVGEMSWGKRIALKILKTLGILASIPVSVILIGTLLAIYEWIIVKFFPGQLLRRAEKRAIQGYYDEVTTIGDTFLERGEKDLAKKLWLRAVDGYAKQYSPGWYGVTSIGDRFEKIGDIDKAKELWSRATWGFATSNNCLGLASIGDRFERIGDIDKAKELWSRAAEGHFSRIFIPCLVVIGDCFERVGDMDNAKKTWLKAAKRYSEEHDLLQAISLYEKGGDFDTASRLRSIYAWGEIGPVKIWSGEGWHGRWYTDNGTYYGDWEDSG